MNPKVFDVLSQIGGGVSVIGGIAGYALAYSIGQAPCLSLTGCPPPPVAWAWAAYGALPGVLIMIGKAIFKSEKT